MAKRRVADEVKPPKEIDPGEYGYRDAEGL